MIKWPFLIIELFFNVILDFLDFMTQWVQKIQNAITKMFHNKKWWFYHNLTSPIKQLKKKKIGKTLDFWGPIFDLDRVGMFWIWDMLNHRSKTS